MPQEVEAVRLHGDEVGGDLEGFAVEMGVVGGVWEGGKDGGGN